jgi:hypothetical protein
MSRGQDFARFNAGARAFLEPDIGPAEDEDCGACDNLAVYRVPWPSVGDVAYCSDHLARYREQHPKLWNRVEEAVDEDLSALLDAEVPVAVIEREIGDVNYGVIRKIPDRLANSGVLVRLDDANPDTFRSRSSYAPAALYDGGEQR